MRIKSKASIGCSTNCVDARVASWETKWDSVKQSRLRYFSTWRARKVRETFAMAAAAATSAVAFLCHFVFSCLLVLCRAHLPSPVGLLAGPVLVVAPLSTVPNWAIEARRWCGDLNVLTYTGYQDSRAALRDLEFPKSSAAASRTAVAHFKNHNDDDDDDDAEEELDEVAPAKKRKMVSMKALASRADNAPPRGGASKETEHRARGGSHVDVILTSYEVALSDASILRKMKFGAVMIDEGAYREPRCVRCALFFLHASISRGAWVTSRVQVTD